MSEASRPLKAPYPWFGGKSSVAPLVWSRFGDVRNFCDPFLGSLAMLLGRPTPFSGTETVNDLDGFVANFWRAVKADPEAVARHADNPVNENDLHARHAWLVNASDGLSRRLEGDPDYHDAKVAGWWAWGACCWIGGGWCSGQGPWNVAEAEDGSRQLLHLGDAGRGVNRKRVHLGDAGRGVNRKRVRGTAPGACSPGWWPCRTGSATSGSAAATGRGSAGRPPPC
jgi:DNA adenine methylase